jgi:NADPH2:quinone reductase
MPADVSRNEASAVAQSRAVRIHRNGGIEELRLETVDVAPPGPNQVLVRHTVAGLNFTDIHHRTGRYPGPGFPLTLGMEGAGVVEAIGENVDGLRAGDRVAYGGATPSLPPGSYCDLRLMDPARLVKLPDWLDDETAAAVILKGLTAQYLLRSAYPLRAGETMLLHAAAGGVGLLMAQWAAHLGAMVIGTVSTEQKAALARAHGCHHAIVIGQEDVAQRVRALTDGQGVSVVYDSVGAATFEMSLASVRRRGTVVTFGSASGPVPPLDVFRLNRLGSLALRGAGLADYIADPAELAQRASELFDVLRSGAVRVTINQRYPLADAAQAHRDLESRRTTGSSVLVL